MEDQQPRLLISSSRKPVSYINLAKRFLQEHGEVQLSALGVAISSMVTLAEILKNKQLAVETRVVTSLEEISSESRTRHKPKMSVTLKKSPQFDDIVAAEGARTSFGQGPGNGLGGEDGGQHGSQSGGGTRHLRGGNAADNGPRGGGLPPYPADAMQQLYPERQQQQQQQQQHHSAMGGFGGAALPGPGSDGYAGGGGMPYGAGPSSIAYRGGAVPQMSQYLPGSGGAMPQPLGLDGPSSRPQPPPGGWSGGMQQQGSGGYLPGGQQFGSAPPPTAQQQQQQQQQYAYLLQQQLQLAQQQAQEAQQQQQQQQLAQQLASLQLAQQQAVQEQAAHQSLPYMGSPHGQQPKQHLQQQQSPHQQQQPCPPPSPYAPEPQQ